MKPGAALARDAAPSLLGPGVVLALALVIGKGVLLGRPEDAGWGTRLLALSWQDVLAVAAIVAAGDLALWLMHERPELARWCWRLLVLASAIALVYTVVHVGFYESFRRAITIQMLRFAGNVSNLGSSVTARLTWPYAIALALLPLAYGWAFRRPRPASRRARGLATALVAAWTLAGQHLQRTSGLEWLDRMAANPHAVLAASVVRELRGSGAVRLPGSFSTEDVAEFRIFGERPQTASAAAAPARIRSVLVVVLESTGSRYLSLYGSRHDTTPQLLAEAGNSLVFDSFYANVGFTVCSFMALNFSLYPGLPWCYLPCGERPLPATLPGLLRERGYRTALLSSADLGYGAMGWMAERNGYQTVRSYWDMDCPLVSSWGAGDRCLVDGVFKFIDEKPGAPFYAMAWTNETHDPYVLSPDAQPLPAAPGQRADLARYLAILRGVDAQLGRLFAGLRERGLDQDTLVVITGDHGEAFGEPHDYVGHGGVLFDEGLRVPLMLWSPRLFGGAGRSARVGAHVDLNPTLAELLGVMPPAGWQGRNLLDPQHPDRAYFLMGLGEYQFGVREGRYKYVYNATFGEGRLYDLEADPDEQHDVAASHPELCRRLLQRLAAFIAYEEKLLLGNPAAPGPVL